MSDKKEEFSNQAEELKKETSETVKDLKESVKNVNIKDETLKTKGFVGEMFKNPIEKVKEIANEKSKYFRTALYILIVWIIAIFIKSTYSAIYYGGFARVFSNILSVLKNILVPVISVLVYSIIILILNKDNKKSLTSILSTVTITKLPMAIAAIISVLTIFSYKLSTITIAFSQLCFIASTVLSYIGYKEIFGAKEDNSFIKKFVLIEIIYAVVYIVFTFLGIYIY